MSNRTFFIVCTILQVLNGYVLYFTDFFGYGITTPRLFAEFGFWVHCGLILTWIALKISMWIEDNWWKVRNYLN